jgi:hypothetical protein
MKHIYSNQTNSTQAIESDQIKRKKGKSFLYGLLVFFMCLLAFGQAIAQEDTTTIQEIPFLDLDNLGEPVYVGTVNAPTLPGTSKSASLLKSAPSFLKSASVTTAPIWPNEGAVNIEKTAEATGDPERWKVNVKVEGKNIKKTTDVVLVIDDSGSMGTSKMEAAKDAAKDFVSELLDGTSTNIRIAVVTINGGSAGNGDPEFDIGFSSDPTAVNNVINAISSNGGTNLQGGFYFARTLLQSQSTSTDNKFVVLLSDGSPTYSYQSNVTSSVTPTIIDCGSEWNWWSGTQYWATWNPSTLSDNQLTVQSSTYNNVVGSGGNFDYGIYTHTETCDNHEYTFEAGNHGIPTAYEAGLLISDGIDVYTIGFEVTAGGDAETVLQNSQNVGYYPASSSNIDDIYAEI